MDVNQGQAKTGRGRQAPEDLRLPARLLLRLGLLARLLFVSAEGLLEGLVALRPVLEQAQHSGSGDQARHLTGDGLEHSGVVVREVARLDRPDREDPDRRSSFQEGHAQIGVETFFVHFREVLVTRMFARFPNGQRLVLLHDQARETFGRTHPDSADCVRGETDGRAQCEERRIALLEQVDRAGIRAHPARHELDDVIERFLEVMGVAHDPPDISKDVQSLALAFRHGKVHTYLHPRAGSPAGRCARGRQRR